MGKLYLSSVVVILLLAQHECYAENYEVNLPSIFSIDIQREVGSDKKITQHYLHYGNKLRSEMPINGKISTTILDIDARKVILFLDDSKEYMIFPYSGYSKNPNIVNIEAVFDKSSDVTVLGEEKLDGLSTKKLLVRSQYFGTVICWMDTTTHLPVKFANKLENHFALWQNFSKDAISASLFEITPGFKFKDLPNTQH